MFSSLRDNYLHQYILVNREIVDYYTREAIWYLVYSKIIRGLYL